MKAFTVAWINIQMYGFKCAVGEILSWQNTLEII